LSDENPKANLEKSPTVGTFNNLNQNKMKDLKTFGVLELDFQTQRTTNGGGYFDIPMLGLLIQTVKLINTIIDGIQNEV
jgi:hypothetical protein